MAVERSLCGLDEENNPDHLSLRPQGPGGPLALAAAGLGRRPSRPAGVAQPAGGALRPPLPLPLLTLPSQIRFAQVWQAVAELLMGDSLRRRQDPPVHLPFRGLLEVSHLSPDALSSDSQVTMVPEEPLFSPRPFNDKTESHKIPANSTYSGKIHTPSDF